MVKATGLVRGLDELGRLTLPIELRRTMDFHPRQPLEIFVDGEDIIIRKYQVGCKICQSFKDLKEVNGLTICKKCADEITERFKNDTY